MQKLTGPILLLALFLFSCSRNKTSPETGSNPTLQNAEDKFDETKIESYLVSSATDSGQLQVIDTTCLVEVQPTDEQIGKDTTEDPDAFNTAAEDYANFMGLNVLYLQSLNVSTLQAEKRYLQFPTVSNQATVLDVRKAGAPEWNLVLFKKGQKPIILSPLDPPDTAAIDNYLQIKR